MQFELDRAAQAFEVMAADEIALAAVRARFAERAAVAGDALLDVVEVGSVASTAMSRWPRPIRWRAAA